tara:strand:+ start:21720 stop:22082 length:363 start_codon:yes stop_codon:yes gene_type:complete
MTGQNKLVTEYYYKRYIESFVLDTFLVAGYLGIASYISSASGYTNVYTRATIVSLTAALLSSLFYLLFSSGFQKGSFFQRWFEAAGVSAILYDVVLVTVVYVGVEAIDRKILSRIHDNVG